MPLMAATREDPLLAVGLLKACLALGIETAPTMQGLAAFWRGHQGPLKMLLPDELAEIEKLKDGRKATLSSGKV